jgi:hypothetical protein
MGLHLRGCRSDEGVLFYSIRAGAGPASPLQGSRLEDDGIPVQPTNDQLLGQIDSVEAGEMTGWACMKGYMGKPLQVRKLPFERPLLPLSNSQTGKELKTVKLDNQS